MWLYLVGALLILVGLVGAIAGGGIFTLILVPVGFVILASAVGYTLLARSAHAAGGAPTDARPSTADPLPHSPSQAPDRPSSPDELVDARRTQQ